MNSKKRFLGQKFLFFFLTPCLLAFANTRTATTYEIDGVYFAQTHVQKMDHPYFRLVSNRPALIKIDLYNENTDLIPLIEVHRTGYPEDKVVLNSPLLLPDSVLNQPNTIESHNRENAFTAQLPAAWIQPDLSLNISINGNAQWRQTINVGADNALIMNMFDVHYFERTNKQYPDQWDTELAAKLPISSLDIRQAKDILFEELVIPRRGEIPPVRVSSKADYAALTGERFDGEQGAALQWVNALQDAAGRSKRWSLYYVNIHGVPAGGQAGGFKGVGYGASHGVLIHELGHALGLPHWQQNQAYPYRGDLLNVNAPAPDAVHVGPTWAYDLNKHAFIPPYLIRAAGREFKRDPMAGGGNNREDPNFLYRHFSDYSVFRMQAWLENQMIRWHAGTAAWQKWDDRTQSYVAIDRTSDGPFPYDLFLPNRPDNDVISVMASISGQHDKGPSHNGLEHINMVYPPIGPFKSGLLPLFDPSNKAHRRAMKQMQYCPEDGCDLTFKVIQGGQEYYYAIAQRFTSSLEDADNALPELATKAINLPASRGAVSYIALLDTPDANEDGLPRDPRILAQWEKRINEPVPESDPVKVFILAGQSNMVGHGNVGSGNIPQSVNTQGNERKGTLTHLINSPDTQADYAHLYDANTQSWRQRDDVWVIEFNCADQSPPDQCKPALNKIMPAGINDKFFGPELGFAHSVGDYYDEPVLIIKTAWGGKSLAVDFLPPSIAQATNRATGPYYNAMMQFAQSVLEKLPELGFSNEYELGGFIWHQGWNDRINQGFNNQYGENLAALVNDVRQTLQRPRLPFILASTGMSGYEESHPRACSLMRAQLSLPRDYRVDFPVNVLAIDTRPFWRPAAESPSGQGYHWNQNAETYYLIGKALGDTATRQYSMQPSPNEPKCESLYNW